MMSTTGQVITQVAAGWYHTVGLTTDGTVLAAGENAVGQCDVGSWTNITQVAAGGFHTVGLKSDGTVVAVGYNDDGAVRCRQLDGHHPGRRRRALTRWGLSPTAPWSPRVGTPSGSANVGDWTDIIQVAAGSFHTVGLKSNGTVVAVGENDYGECNVGEWTDIIQICRRLGTHGRA